jgi:carboxyl-terminal processing protease
MRQIHLSLFFCFLLASSGAAVSQESKPHAEDVAFLLKEFETKAGRLIALKGIDWKAVRAEFTAAAEGVKTDQEQYQWVARLVGCLQDGHAGIVRSTLKPFDESKGRRFTGPRVHLLVSEGKVLVRAAFKDAARAGLRAGQEVVSIDGVPARKWLEERVRWMRARGSGFSTAQQALYAACHWGLADWAGTPITFEVKDPSGGLKTVKRVRNGGPNFVPFGPIFPPENLKFVGRQSYGRTRDGFGYIHLRNVPQNLPEQIDQMLKEIGDVPGLILDMRANGGGGCDHAAVFGQFLAKEKRWSHYQGAGEHSYAGPMVVIVDAGTRSAGETVAGMFKEDGRAYMIGDSPTAGTSSRKVEVTTPSGAFTVRFSVRSNMGRFNQGRGLEGIGVAPHEIVPVKADDLLKEEDTLIKRAVELLRQGIPAGVVPYKGTVRPD